ncbi:hypothetical protein ID866_13258, partial [Astraeus odoratus]
RRSDAIRRGRPGPSERGHRLLLRYDAFLHGDN